MLQITNSNKYNRKKQTKLSALLYQIFHVFNRIIQVRINTEIE